MSRSARSPWRSTNETYRKAIEHRWGPIVVSRTESGLWWRVMTKPDRETGDQTFIATARSQRKALKVAFLRRPDV